MVQTLHGILFDLDGTLADSQLDFTAMCDELAIPHHTPLLEYQQSLSCAHDIARVTEVIEKHEMAGAHAATWIADAEQLVQQLHARNIPMAIVTRNMRKATQLMLEKLNMPITLVVTREDCEQVKPHPEGLLKIANQWGISPERLAYVGDFKFDLLAAKRANMKAMLWRNEHNAEFESLADHSIIQFKQLLDFFPSA